MAGIVTAIGSSVTLFSVGDRVAGFHRMVKPGGAFAEYGIAPEWATLRLPAAMSFEEGATLPLAMYTSALGVYVDLGITPPWMGVRAGEPLLVYGASSATGDYAAQLGRLAGCEPIIGVAGAGKVAKEVCDVVVDYRGGEEKCVADLKAELKKLGRETVGKVYDAISEKGSHEIQAQVVEKGSKVTHLLPVEDFAKSGKGFRYPEGVGSTRTSVGQIFEEHVDFGTVVSAYISRALAEGKFKPHPHEVIPGGLGGVERALKQLREGKASGVKYVFRIAETPELSK